MLGLEAARLGLETARIPHADRNGLLWLGRGRLFVDAGTLRFATVGLADMDAGEYDIAFQGLSVVLLTPGTSVTHDALRLLSRHGTGLLVVGEGGVRLYSTVMPFGPDSSSLARRQVELWANAETRIRVAKRMYEMRMGQSLPQNDINALRGIEGSRAKTMYRNLAQQYGIKWCGRRFDRNNPLEDDLPNQAINHASSAVRGAAMIATASVGAIPQIGFIHEGSGNAFSLDIADLFRDEIIIPVAFKATKNVEMTKQSIERCVRKLAGDTLRKRKIISLMIDRIKELFEDADDNCGDS